MSKHDKKTDSTEADAAKAEQANVGASEANDPIVEGEVVNEPIDEKIARGRAYSASKAPKGPSWKDKLKKGFRYLLWAAVVVAVVAVFILTRPNTDWQVQHINDLQTEVAELQQANKALETRLDDQDVVIDQRVQELVAAAMAKPENQSIVTKADLETLQQTSNQKLTELQTNLTALSDQLANQVDKAVTGVADFATENQQRLQPTEEQLAALKTLEEKVQSQLTDMGGKLSELFDFKSRQQAQVVQQSTAVPSDKLTARQIQHWIAELNTQWLMKGNLPMTRAQLLNLEKVVTVSQIKEATTVTRLIGQDLAYLEQFESQASANLSLNTQSLRDAVKALKVEKNQQAQSSAEEAISSTTGAEEINTESALEQLKSRLSDMIRVKKRDESEGTTQVDSLLMQDVMLQRALLLIDRIDWAVQSESSDLLKASSSDLQQFIDQYFGKHSARFEILLKPFSEASFVQRKSLAITQFKAVE